jgi:osmotically-inducible protein OsmY
MPNRDWGRDDDGMGDERWRRDMGRDFSRHEWSPYDRERDMREMRDREMRDRELRDRELRGDYRESGFGYAGTDRYFGGGGYGGYGNYGERGYGGHSMAERSMGDRGGYRSEYYERERPMGRAPKGYQRSDERIKEDVCDRLMHSWVDAENVDIEVRSGEVVLAGTVEDRQAKRAIEDIADRVLGVKDVQNNIRVRPRGAEEQQRTTTSPKTPSA